VNHSQFAFIPMCTPTRGNPWFAPNAMRYLAKDSRDAFIDMCGYPGEDATVWKALKIEGWRIVKVKVATVPGGGK
jgi:hypothetical protein